VSQYLRKSNEAVSRTRTGIFLAYISSNLEPYLGLNRDFAVDTSRVFLHGLACIC